MSIETLTAVLSDVFGALPINDELNIVWHAGEPLTLGRSFFDQAFAEVAKISTGRCRTQHRIQTNGLLLTDSWCDFLLPHNVRIGLSVDGPSILHDRSRVTRKGGGTHAFAMRAMNLLRRRGFSYQVICVLSSSSLDMPEELIDFFIDHDVDQVGFNVETIEGANAASSLSSPNSPIKLRSFWLRILKRIGERRSRISVREVDSAVEFVLSKHNSQMTRYDNSPLAMITVDVDGNYYTFSPELAGLRDIKGKTYAIGNVASLSLTAAMRSQEYLQLVAEVQAGVEICRKACRYYRVCGGGSPSNKLAENGSFASGETEGCRLSTKVLFDALGELIPEVADAVRRRDLDRLPF